MHIIYHSTLFSLAMVQHELKSETDITAQQAWGKEWNTASINYDDFLFAFSYNLMSFQTVSEGIY